MYVSSHRHIDSHSEFFRDWAAASGGTLVACWIGLLVLEAVRFGHVVPNVHSFPQAIVLALIFASYAISWRHELLGGILGIIGTAVFFAVSYLSTQIVPPLPAALFSLPGVLSILAWTFQDKHLGARHAK